MSGASTIAGARARDIRKWAGRSGWRYRNSPRRHNYRRGTRRRKRFLIIAGADAKCDGPFARQLSQRNAGVTRRKLRMVQEHECRPRRSGRNAICTIRFRGYWLIDQPRHVAGRLLGIRTQNFDAIDALRRVLVNLQLGNPHGFAGEMLTGEDPHATWLFFRRPVHRAEPGLCPPTVGKIDRPAEIQRTGSSNPLCLQFGDTFGRIEGCERRPLDALALIEKRAGAGIVLGRRHNTQQLDIIRPEHDRVITRPQMSAVQAPRRYRETQLRPSFCRSIQIANGNDDVIETNDLRKRHGGILFRTRQYRVSNDGAQDKWLSPIPVATPLTVS